MTTLSLFDLSANPLTHSLIANPLTLSLSSNPLHFNLSTNPLTPSLNANSLTLRPNANPLHLVSVPTLSHLFIDLLQPTRLLNILPMVVHTVFSIGLLALRAL